MKPTLFEIAKQKAIQEARDLKARKEFRRKNKPLIEIAYERHCSFLNMFLKLQDIGCGMK